MPFRKNAAAWALTYPRCPLGTEYVAAQLEAICIANGHSVQSLLVSSEHHHDYGLHIHVFLRLDRRWNLRDPTVFDITPLEGEEEEEEEDQTDSMIDLTSDGELTPSSVQCLQSLTQTESDQPVNEPFEEPMEASGYEDEIDQTLPIPLAPNGPSMECSPCQGTYHPNIRTAPYPDGWIEYLHKDPVNKTIWKMSLRDQKVVDQIVAGNPPSARKRKRPPVNQIIAQKIIDGASFEDLLCEDNVRIIGYMVQHGKSLEWFLERKRRAEETHELLDWPAEWVSSMTECSFSEALYSTRQRIFRWLGVNVWPIPKEGKRRHKQKQLWIVSPTNFGKTTFIRWLDLHLKLYYAPMVQTHWETYRSFEYSCVVFDEFNGSHIQPAWLNRFVEGAKYTLVGRHVSPQKSDNPAVIVCSNLHPTLCYPNVNARVMDALLARFEVIEFESYMQDDPLLDHNDIYILPSDAPNRTKIM